MRALLNGARAVPGRAPAAAGRGGRRLFAKLFLVGVLLQAAGGAAALVARALGEVARLSAERHDPPEARLARHYGADYLAAIQRIRSRVAEGDFYLLVDAEPEERGASYVANYFLAPRRAILIGRTRLEREELIGRRLAQRKLADWVVWVPALPGAPELLDRAEAAARLRAQP